MVQPLRFTNVWIKRDGKWLIVAEHSSRETASRELIPKSRFFEKHRCKINRLCLGLVSMENSFGMNVDLLIW